MDNIEQQSGIKFPKKIGKYAVFIGWGIISLGMAIGLGLGQWDKIKDREYARGVNEGQNALVNQLTAGARINLEKGVILFVPNQ